MPAHKVTLFFSAAVPLAGSAIQPADATQGWSESWYRAADESDQQALVPVSPGGAYFTARRAMLTPGWRISGARAIRFPGTRTGARAAFTPIDGQGRYVANQATVSGVQDEAAYDSLVMTVSSVGGSIRSWLMRGIGPDVVGGSGQYSGTPTFEGLRPALTAALAAGFGLRRSTSPATVGIANVVTSGAAIIGNSAPSPQQPQIVFANAAPAIVAGMTIRISGVTAYAGLNGLWVVAAVGGAAGSPGIQLQAKRGRTVFGVSGQGGGVISAKTYAIDSFATVFPEFGTSRKTGRPPTVRRGRRKARV